MRRKTHGKCGVSAAGLLAILIASAPAIAGDDCTVWEKIFGRASGGLCPDVPKLNESEYRAANLDAAIKQIPLGKVDVRELSETVRQKLPEPSLERLTVYNLVCAAYRYCAISRDELQGSLRWLQQEAGRRDAADAGADQIPKPTVCFGEESWKECPGKEPYCRYVKSNDNEVKAAFYAVRCKKLSNDKGWDFVDYQARKSRAGCIVRTRVACPTP